MKFIHEVAIDCTGLTPEDCSNLCLVKLGHAPTLKLKASNSIESVHGAVTIIHKKPPAPHVIEVEIYEADQGRQKKPAVMPKAADLTAALNTMAVPG